MRTKTFLLVLFTLLVTSVFVRADYDVDVMGTDIGSVWGSGPHGRQCHRKSRGPLRTDCDRSERYHSSAIVGEPE